MTSRHSVKLVSGTSVLKYQKLTRLCRKLWRNMHNSGYEFPAYHRSSVRRNIHNSERCSNNSTPYPFRYKIPMTHFNLSNETSQGDASCTEDYASTDSASKEQYGGEISDDDSDYIIFPSSDNIKVMESPCSIQSLGEIPIGRNIEGRRPLHIEKDYGKDSPQKHHHIKAQRRKTVPYRTPDRKSSIGSGNDENHEVESDEEVKFVKEIKPKRCNESTGFPLKHLGRTFDGKPSTSIVFPNKIKDLATEDSIEIRPLYIRRDNASIHSKRMHITLRLNDDSIQTDTQLFEGDDANCPKLVDSPLSHHSRKSKIFEDDDDLIVVQSDHNNDAEIGHATLKRIVISMVTHYAEENNEEEVKPQYILSRLRALYHRDFSHRSLEIKHCIRRGLERCKTMQVTKLFREVRPGVRHSDINTLSSENWLNDIIIDQYMSILVKDQPKFGAISSFWYEELLRGKEPSSPPNWQKLKSILVPTCVASHWSLLCYSPRSNDVRIYSSMPVCEAEVQCGQALLKFFCEKLGVRDNGECHEISGLPRQENEHDCGVYVCMFARCIVCGNSYDILPQQVCEFRTWLKNEIVKGRLFGAREDFEEEG